MRHVIETVTLVIALTFVGPAAFADGGGGVFEPPIFSGDTVTVPGMGEFQIVGDETEFELEVEGNKAKWKLKGEIVLVEDPTSMVVLDELEYEKVAFVFLEVVMDLTDPRIVQPREDPRFSQESRAGIGLEARLGPNRLESDLPMQVLVESFVEDRVRRERRLQRGGEAPRTGGPVRAFDNPHRSSEGRK